MLDLQESQSLDPAPLHLPDATEFRWAFLRNKTEAPPDVGSSLRKLERQLVLDWVTASSVLALARNV